MFIERVRPSFPIAWIVAAAVWGGAARADNPSAPAELVVTDRVLRPAADVPPIGVNLWGGAGAVEWAANNFVFGPGNEPVHWQNLHRAKEVGDGWFEPDGPGVSNYDLYASGLLSGAELRVYRLVTKAGAPVPPKDDYLDVAQADRVELVDRTRILTEGSEGFPDGGFVVTRYCQVFPNANVRHGNLRATDINGITGGGTYWYVVRALGPDGAESELSDEISVTTATGDGGPRIVVHNDGDNIPAFEPGEEADFTPKVFGGQPPLKWEAAEALPAGLSVDESNGRVSGKIESAIEDAAVTLRVADAAGEGDERAYVLNPSPRTGEAASKDKPQPPTNVRAESSGDGFVTLAWDASPSANVTAYRVMRSTQPKAEQVNRIYVEADGAKIEKFDYVVVEKKFDRVDMGWVSPRVRGIGNPMDSPVWPWNGDLSKMAISIVPHSAPLPPEMVEAGESCLQIEATGEGDLKVWQTAFHGAQEDNKEAIWYGQLEPGKHYLMEAWLRQENLGDGGKVTFSFGGFYPDLKQSFDVTGEWKKYAFEFDGPERPVNAGHAGPQFDFAGPGTLWLDNVRVARIDDPADADKPYVPNKTVLDMLISSQPEGGRKGAHRIWFLERDATMPSIMSWHANSKVRPDWQTTVQSTLRMTLPMGLMFDLETGDDAASRMRPWLVLGHIVHDEQDWLNLVEYLAAPYDPAVDSPEEKPWAFKRYQQRGNVGTPWTDEFESITIEFGNETWHNGVVSDDWLGFSMHGKVTQGGPEYGLFTRYLVENMKKSPYWQAQNLDEKLLFSLGAFYNGQVEEDGTVSGYAETAVPNNPYVATVGHANYIGPKWETGDEQSKSFNDHGVQASLFAYISGTGQSVKKWGEARDALEKAGHNYDLVAYEGGPSGYALPGQAPDEQVEVNEKYGKSLAMAVGAIDSWMDCYAHGYTDQCFFTYGQGGFWNTHTIFADGFRPHVAWLAMAMRNHYASGDLMAVEAKSTPTLTFGVEEPRDYPLVGSYAMRDGDKWSVFVVSRKLDGTHDGHDFGDGRTPVTLRLPFESAGKITLHQIGGDPRRSNRDAANFEVETSDVAADALRDRTLSIDLPPGAIFLYVFEAANVGER